MLLQPAKPFAPHDHPREIVRQFAPNWFTVSTGTGVVALALIQFPIDLPILHQSGAVLWLVWAPYGWAWPPSPAG